MHGGNSNSTNEKWLAGTPKYGFDKTSPDIKQWLAGTPNYGFDKTLPQWFAGTPKYGFDKTSPHVANPFGKSDGAGDDQ